MKGDANVRAASRIAQHHRRHRCVRVEPLRDLDTDAIRARTRVVDSKTSAGGRHDGLGGCVSRYRHRNVGHRLYERGGLAGQGSRHAEHVPGDESWRRDPLPDVACIRQVGTRVLDLAGERTETQAARAGTAGRVGPPRVHEVLMTHLERRAILAGRRALSRHLSRSRSHRESRRAPRTTRPECSPSA